MFALSIRQPWAYLIVNGFKDIENRSWKTNFRGEVLIHASKGMTGLEYDDAEELFSKVFPKSKLPDFDKLPRGGIVGKSKIIDCVKEYPSPWFFGRHGFVMKDSEPLPFEPLKGQLGFFKV